MHAIRLRGPWEYQVLLDFAQVDVAASRLPTGKVQMPTDWGDSLGRDFRGRVRYLRNFNRPTGIEDAKVFLFIAAVDCLANIAINGETLGQITGFETDQRFDITDRLQPSNRLQIVVELPNAVENAPRPEIRTGQPGGLIGEVRLEIYE